MEVNHMKGRIDSGLGQIIIDTDVIATYAGSVAVECFGIIGMAGTTNMPSSGQWWEDRRKMIGIVNHEHEGKKWVSKYADELNNNIKETIMVDGLFFAVSKERLKSNFVDEFQGFHFYDVAFCFEVECARLR